MRLIDADALRADAITRSGGTEFAFDNCYPFWQFSQAIAQAPTIEAAPINNNPCGFCGKFNFGDAKVEVYSHGANIVFASALTRFPVEEQFNFCPVCGRRVKKGGASND